MGISYLFYGGSAYICIQQIQMRFTKTIDYKYSHIDDKQTDVRKPAVSATLRAFLENQSIRIDNVIAKKKLHNQMLNKIANENMSYRNTLRTNIEQAQEKHEKNRDKFLEKRVKAEKFKLEEVQRRRTALFQKLKEKRKSNDETFKKHRSQTVDFWKTKQLNTKKSYESQGLVAPLHEDAVSRKKFIEKRNESYADQERDKLFTRHSEVSQRIQNIVFEKRRILEEYDEKLEEGYHKNLDILQKKELKFVNSICFHRDRSESLLKTAKAAYKKKMEGKMIDIRDNIDKKKQNYTERNIKRAQSMKECRCHKKGSTINSPEYGMTHSITLNEQQGKNSPLGLNTKRQSWSVMQTRKNFMVQSQANLSSVKNNKSILRQRQDLKDEKKLMTEKQITDAVNLREDIKTQSNLLVRQARVLA